MPIKQPKTTRNKTKNKAKKVKISPPIRKDNRKLTYIEDLEQGDFFLFDGSLWILTQADPKAINLSEDRNDYFNNNDIVVPVNAEIKWTKK